MIWCFLNLENGEPSYETTRTNVLVLLHCYIGKHLLKVRLKNLEEWWSGDGKEHTFLYLRLVITRPTTYH